MVEPEEIRVKVFLPRDGSESVPSLYGLFRGADWQERETFDMFGIVFEGHPHPKRLLMPEDWGKATLCARTTFSRISTKCRTPIDRSVVRLFAIDAVRSLGHTAWIMSESCTWFGTLQICHHNFISLGD